MKKKGKKIWIVLGIVAVVVVAAFLVLPKVLKPKVNLASMYKTHKVEKGEFKVSIQGTGNIVSSNEKSVVLNLSGQVKDLSVKVGDRVEQGQALFTIYNESLEDSISSTEDSIAQQEISASKLNNQLSSYKYYAPIDGYVYNLKAVVGDDAANIAKAYGGICQIVPDKTVELACSTTYSTWNVTDRAITINQKVYVLSRYDHSVKPTEARVKNVSGTTFTVEVPAGFGNIGTLTDVYCAPECTAYDKLGEGTIKFVDPISITGTGKLAKIYVTENQQVKKGDLLFEFDASDVQKSIQSAGITIDGLEDTLQKNKDKLANNVVAAPIGGILSSLTAVEGGNVAAGASVATIVDTGAQEIVIQVDELDVPKVKLGQTAVITVDALPDKEFTGTVTKIAELGTVANSITTYNVTITVADTTGIKIGMSATAEILVEQRDGVIMVPVDYIENFNDKKRVRVIPAGVKLDDPKTWKQSEQGGIPVPFEWREVTIGSSNADETEILSGLNEGDTIVMIDTSSSNNFMMFAPMGGGQRNGNRAEGTTRTTTTTSGGRTSESDGGNQNSPPNGG